MLQWIKKHIPLLTTILVTVGVLIYVYGCEAKVSSLWRKGTLINRQELQLELDQLIGLAQLRMAALDKQELLRALIVRNALVLVQGQPFNPVGIIAGIASIYGVTQGASNVTKVVKTKLNKRKANNG